MNKQTSVNYILLFLLIGIVFLAGCTSQNYGQSNEPKIVCYSPYKLIGNGCCLDQNSNGICDENETSSKQILESVADVGTIVHNHWTENDTNDGNIVYVGLVNKRNTYISDEIRNLTVTLTIKGLDESYKNYSVVLFEKTYTNVSLSDIDYPKGSGFVILFNELKRYNQECCVAIFAEVTLRNGKILKTHEPHYFDIKPIVY